MRHIAIVGLLTFLLAGAAEAGASRIGHRLLVIDGHQLRWAKAAGETLVLKYAFLSDNRSFPWARNCRRMGPIGAHPRQSAISGAAFKREVAAGLKQWSRVADIRFQEVNDGAQADIMIGLRQRREGSAFADVLPLDIGRGRRTIGKSLICFSPAHAWKIGFNRDLARYDVRYVAMHEAGHAIGLDHPSPSGEVMSFRYLETFRTLQAGDVLGAVRLYGHARRPITRLVSHQPK